MYIQDLQPNYDSLSFSSHFFLPFTFPFMDDILRVLL